MTTKELLDLLKQYPNVKRIQAFPGKDTVIEIEMFEPKKEVQEVDIPTLPLGAQMPPDDVMQFAATEDIEELMKQRES